MLLWARNGSEANGKRTNAEAREVASIFLSPNARTAPFGYFLAPANTPGTGYLLMFPGPGNISQQPYLVFEEKCTGKAALMRSGKVHRKGSINAPQQLARAAQGGGEPDAEASPPGTAVDVSPQDLVRAGLSLAVEVDTAGSADGGDRGGRSNSGAPGAGGGSNNGAPGAGAGNVEYA